MNNKDENKKISIDELDYAIHQCRAKTIGAEFINFDFLKYASERLMKIANFKEEPIYVKYYSHEEAIAIVLDFFKSLQVDEWYNKARDILFSLNERIGINIFNYQDVNKLKTIDHNGIKMYSVDSSIESKIDDDDNDKLIKNQNPKSLIRIAKNSRYYGIDNIFSKDKMTLEDLQTIIHEISHSFDMSNNMESIEKRNIISEITPFCFEKMFNEYFTSKSAENRAIIKSINTMRCRDVMYHTRYVYTVINLFKIQKTYGKITKEGIDDFLRKKDIRDIDYVRKCFMDVIDSDYNFDFHVKYMIAGLASSMYLKKFKENKQEALNKLQEYCKCLKDGDVSEVTLERIGFDQEKQGVDNAVEEFTEDFKGSR